MKGPIGGLIRPWPIMHYRLNVLEYYRLHSRMAVEEREEEGVGGGGGGEAHWLR